VQKVAAILEGTGLSAFAYDAKEQRARVQLRLPIRLGAEILLPDYLLLIDQHFTLEELEKIAQVKRRLIAEEQALKAGRIPASDAVEVAMNSTNGNEAE
jgi:hypothetical protein